MIPIYDYRKYKVLFVDDEEKACKYFTRAFENTFDIITCENGVEASNVFKERKDEIAVIVTDQRMPEMTGVEFLDEVYRSAPDIIRILSTAYSDLTAAVDAVNRGQIYKYVTKPWDISGMEANLRRGMEFFLLKKERDQLVKSKLVGLERMIGLSRVTSLTLAPVLQGHAIKNLNAVVFNFLKLGYTVFDELDFGYSNFFDDFSKGEGFYEGFKKKNAVRLTALVEGCKQFSSPEDALSELATILAAELNENKTALTGVNQNTLKDVFQGLFGYNADEKQTELSQKVFHLLLSLAQDGSSLTYSGQTQTYELKKIENDQDTIESLLDDELLLARIGGAL